MAGGDSWRLDLVRDLAKETRLPGTHSLFLLLVFLLLASPSLVRAHTPHICPSGIVDSPAINDHLSQGAIEGGAFSLRDLFLFGRTLFTAPFNVCDGQGRPAATGTGEKRVPNQPLMLRTSAPDSNSCGGCHNQPDIGGSGDFVANVFVLAQALDPVTLSISSEFSNERNTLGMHGAGPIEMLAREMTGDLQSQAKGLADGTHALVTKGVEFQVTIEDGKVVASEGVDTDLVIKPFHQSGVVRSIREFTLNAFNHHFGMQPAERFDLNPDKGFDPDFDEDGVPHELSVGDITAAVLFQAALGTPGRVLPKDPGARGLVEEGEQIFERIGCARCHVPEMTLNTRHYSEPNPLNPPGTLSDTTRSISFDMTRQGSGPRLERGPRNKAIVRAYTDLKRHSLCDAENRFFCNEELNQDRPDQGHKPGADFFITRKLWDVGSSAPYGHRGDLSTIFEAILEHGGEAANSSLAFVGLAQSQQAAIVEFLRSLRVLPTRCRSQVVFEGNPCLTKGRL